MLKKFRNLKLFSKLNFLMSSLILQFILLSMILNGEQIDNPLIAWVLGVQIKISNDIKSET